MDFNGIVRSSYSWVSVSKAIWFVIFFWITLPFIIILPKLFDSGALYSEVTRPIAVVLYDILYIALILGVILLIQHCLAEKNGKVYPLSARRVIDIVFLVFVELFYVFVWNIDKRLKNIQLLLIISSLLLGYLFLATFNTAVLVLFSWSLLGYFALVIRNFIRVFFSTTIFCNKDSIGLKGAVKESWGMTHNRVEDTFSAIIVSGFLAFILFAFVTLALGTIAALLLRFFFIDSVSISLGFTVSTAFGLGIALIAYHFMIAEVFSQLNGHHTASINIKKILARRVLSPAVNKRAAPRRSFAKVKAKKKKSRR